MSALKEYLEKKRGPRSDPNWWCAMAEISDRLDALEQQAHSHAVSQSPVAQDERGCDEYELPDLYHAGVIKPKAQEQLWICPKREECERGCLHKEPHIKNWNCDNTDAGCTKCIPYAQEQGGDDCWHCAKCGMPDLRARLADEKKSCLDFEKGVDEMAKALDYVKGICDRGGYEGTEKEKLYVPLRILGYVKKLESKLQMSDLNYDALEKKIVAVEKENAELKRQLKSEVTK